MKPRYTCSTLSTSKNIYTCIIYQFQAALLEHHLFCFSLFFFFFNLINASVITCGVLWTFTHYFVACPALRDCTFKSHLLQQQQDCWEVTAPSIANSPESEPLGVVWVKPQDSWNDMHTGKPKNKHQRQRKTEQDSFPLILLTGEIKAVRIGWYLMNCFYSEECYHFNVPPPFFFLKMHPQSLNSH